jgi:biopolymer transport protein ExbD
VLLVILIFLMLSTTYSKYSELQITLPTADAERIRERPAEIIVSISAEGRYLIDKKPVEGRSVDILTLELQAAAAGRPDVMVIVSAVRSRPQAVINVRRGAPRRTRSAVRGAGTASPQAAEEALCSRSLPSGLVSASGRQRSRAQALPRYNSLPQGGSIVGGRRLRRR